MRRISANTFQQQTFLYIPPVFITLKKTSSASFGERGNMNIYINTTNGFTFLFVGGVLGNIQTFFIQWSVWKSKTYFCLNILYIVWWISRNNFLLNVCIMIVPLNGLWVEMQNSDRVGHRICACLFFSLNLQNIFPLVPGIENVFPFWFLWKPLAHKSYSYIKKKKYNFTTLIIVLQGKLMLWWWPDISRVHKEGIGQIKHVHKILSSTCCNSCTMHGTHNIKSKTVN